MYRIDVATAVATLQVPAAAGAAGHFGDTVGGVDTIVPADWLNALDVELGNLVVAGGLTPTKPTTNVTTDAPWNQVRDAVRALAAAGPTRAQFQGQQAAGVDSGEAIAGTTWTARVLNATVSNGIASAALAANQVTLPAGTYRFTAAVVAVSTAGTIPARARLRNATDNTTLSPSPSAAAFPAAGVAIGWTGIFTLAATKAVQLESYLDGAGNGGVHAGTGEVEVYADLLIEKIG